MVTITKDKKKYFKILYWGPASSGKTTALATLFNICSEQDKELKPTGNLVRVVSGPNLYFDRGRLQSRKETNIYFYCYTVAGKKRFQPVRKKISLGTDGIIFVADSQRSRLQDNIDSLRELKRVTDGNLIKKIPILVMLNKRDLDDLISVEEWEEIMKDEELRHPQNHYLADWNPITYETVALPGQKQKNIYPIFSELARRCIMYQVYGEDGKAPKNEPIGMPDWMKTPSKLAAMNNAYNEIRINEAELLRIETLKREKKMTEPMLDQAWFELAKANASISKKKYQKALSELENALSHFNELGWEKEINMVKVKIQNLKTKMKEA